MLHHADSKRQKGQEILQDSYLTHQAASFADKQAEKHLREAQKVVNFFMPPSPAMRKYVCLPGLLLAADMVPSEIFRLVRSKDSDWQAFCWVTCIPLRTEISKREHGRL